MKHLGDITKISGYELDVPDVVCGGSPCQDLSVAGKRAGLAGERSGLFMEQIRLVKELRERDKQLCPGRADNLRRPRYMLWENVPGAFSSAGKGCEKGSDFAAVLEETIKVVQPDIPPVEIPQGGWPKCGLVYDEMGRWSVAYSTHDAQFWGVPQRRRRIALVADFNGLTAGEIMFSPEVRREAERTDADNIVGDSGRESRPEVQPVSQSLSRDFEPVSETWETTSTDIGRSPDGTDFLNEPTE